METKCDNYKAAIKNFIKQGKVEEAMKAVDTLAIYALHVGMKYQENCNQNGYKEPEENSTEGT